MCKKRKPVNPPNQKGENAEPTLGDICQKLDTLEKSQTQGRFATVLSITGATLMSIGFAMSRAAYSNQSASENQKRGWIILAVAGVFFVIQAIALLLGQAELDKIKSPRELFRIEYVYLLTAFVFTISACVLISF